MANITEYPEVEQIGNDDKVFVNVEGQLKQTKSRNIGGGLSIVKIADYTNSEVSNVETPSQWNTLQGACEFDISDTKNVMVNVTVSGCDCLYSTIFSMRVMIDGNEVGMQGETTRKTRSSCNPTASGSWAYMQSNFIVEVPSGHHTLTVQVMPLTYQGVVQGGWHAEIYG